MRHREHKNYVGLVFFFLLFTFAEATEATGNSISSFNQNCGVCVVCLSAAGQRDTQHIVQLTSRCCDPTGSRCFAGGPGGRCNSLESGCGIPAPHHLCSMFAIPFSTNAVFLFYSFLRGPAGRRERRERTAYL